MTGTVGGPAQKLRETVVTALQEAAAALDRLANTGSDSDGR